MASSAYSGSLFIISAPSGTGKSSLVKAVLDKDTDVALSISYTTRPRRATEVDGVHYHFIDQTQFDNIKTDNGFLEYAQVHGHGYGTSRNWIESKMAADEDVLLEIDWQGAQQIMTLIPYAVSIFILPPSFTELERRLRGRGTDSNSVISRRMATASTELAQAYQYDYVILNDDFETALQELCAIIVASRCRLRQQYVRHARHLQQFGL